MTPPNPLPPSDEENLLTIRAVSRKIDQEKVIKEVPINPEEQKSVNDEKSKPNQIKVTDRK